MDNTYSLINLVVLPFWLLMILAPRWNLTRSLMSATWPVTIVPLFYAILLFTVAGDAGAGPLDFSLAGIAALLGTPSGALIAWAHFLAFDLFVGRWAYLDSLSRPLSPWLVSMALFMIFMAGPLGLLLYLGLRALRRPVPLEI